MPQRRRPSENAPMKAGFAKNGITPSVGTREARFPSAASSTAAASARTGRVIRRQMNAPTTRTTRRTAGNPSSGNAYITSTGYFDDVLASQRMLGYVNLVGSVLYQFCRQVFDAVTQDDRGQFHAQRIGKMPGLAHQFDRRIFQPPVMLLGENPNFTFSINFYHFSSLVSRISNCHSCGSRDPLFYFSFMQ